MPTNDQKVRMKIRRKIRLTFSLFVHHCCKIRRQASVPSGMRNFGLGTNLHKDKRHNNM